MMIREVPFPISRPGDLKWGGREDSQQWRLWEHHRSQRRATFLQHKTPLKPYSRVWEFLLVRRISYYFAYCCKSWSFYLKQERKHTQLKKKRFLCIHEIFLHAFMKDSMHSLTYRCDLTSMCGFNLCKQSIP